MIINKIRTIAQLIYCLLLFIYNYFELLCNSCYNLFYGSSKIILIRFVPLEIWISFGIRYFPICIYMPHFCTNHLYVRACFLPAVLAALIFCLYESVFELIVLLIT